MKKFLAFLLLMAMIISVVACGPDKTTEIPETTITEQTPDLNANALLVLEEICANHICDDTFIDVILTQVPDVFMLTDYRAACWTYFLVMSDGIEYIVTIDYNGKITSIAYWNPDVSESGEPFYKWSE